MAFFFLDIHAGVGLLGLRWTHLMSFFGVGLEMEVLEWGEKWDFLSAPCCHSPTGKRVDPKLLEKKP